jgi:Ca2+-binding RTX toxin-like protein
VITTGAGDDVIVGGEDGERIDEIAGPSPGTSAPVTSAHGTNGDRIVAGSGRNLVFGDNGRTTAAPAAAPRFGSVALTLGRVETVAPGIGGADTISTGTGDDIVLGGTGGDTITIDGGSNLVIGDGGFLDAVTADGDASDLDRIQTTTPNDGGADTITIGGAGNNYVLGGIGGDTITTAAGGDLIFGDFGELVGDIAWTYPVPAGPAPFRWTSIDTQNTHVIPTGASLPSADDTIRSGAGRDIVLGGQGGDVIYGGDGDDDLTGGHNVALGQDGGDRIDGGRDDDVIAGDNAEILPRGDSVSLRIRTLTATTIYSVTADGIVANVSAAAAANPTGVAERFVVLFDHGLANATLFGDDQLAGGAHDDVVFGQMGNDRIQGDGSIDLDVGTWATPGVTVEDLAGAGTDGDDYVEGGGGNDLVFGGLGQDDLIGGSSDLYLAAGATRPDGVDKVYGGAGTRIALDDAGLTGTGAHARDADVILGDNGRILRLRDGAGFLRYAYDGYDPTLKLIPRATVLLDYSPTGDVAHTTCDPASPSVCTTSAGTGANIGGGDFLHGEGGDDVVHGQTGNDTIFGEGQDDQLYGESGGDWIAGGTGDDGILGDDGLLHLQRNGVAEPLNGLAATTQTPISQNGDKQVVTAYQTGELRYVADLEPFSTGGNDIAYGGLGNDALHGGAGDDAMSGAEALAFYYGLDPLGTLASLAALYTAGNVLGYDPATTLFRYYDPENPLRKIMVAPGIDFLLNFIAGPNTPTAVVRDDGKDVLFGDVGNDWLVGGTNEDHLWGGYGDDYLQADDNLDSTAGTADPLANDVTDARSTGTTYADIAFGGAGRDVLIANTYVDRLLDWSGEFNSYLVPFSPFGNQTVLRWISPGAKQWALDISRADGADPTRGSVDNGEPFGEIGLVDQDDADWGDQHGGPRDPQPGNGKGKRDTTSIAFTTGSTSISSTSTATISSGTTTTTTPVLVPPPPAPLPPGQAKKNS